MANSKQPTDFAETAVLPGHLRPDRLEALDNAVAEAQGRYQEYVRSLDEVPVLVDAGVGTASDAAIALGLGCDGVLMNSAIAQAQNPVLMAGAMKKAVQAGREAFLAGRMPKKLYSAIPSSPTIGLIGK